MSGVVDAPRALARAFYRGWYDGPGAKCPYTAPTYAVEWFRGRDLAERHAGRLIVKLVDEAEAV